MVSPRRLAKSAAYRLRQARIAALAVPRAIPWLREPLRLPPNRVFEPLLEPGTAGVSVTLLEPVAIFERPLPSFSPGSEAARGFFASRRIEHTAPAYVAEIDGGIAWGHPTGGVFTRDGRFVPAFTHDPSGPKFHAVWTRLSLPRPQRLPGRTLYLVTPEATSNYHHWMIDLLPRIAQVRRAGHDLAGFDHVIVNHAGLRYQFATLERLGIEPDKLVAAHRRLFVQAEQLVVPSLKADNQTLPPADVAALRAAFLGPGAPRTSGHRIFLSREGTSHRRLQNESELHRWLRVHDFEIMVAGELDVPAQARRFAEASVIAGPAGAAFANLVFAAPGACVVEIVSPQWLAAFHWMISARVGLEHTILLGQGTVARGVPDADARRTDIVLDAERFEALLETAAAPH